MLYLAYKFVYSERLLFFIVSKMFKKVMIWLSVVLISSSMIVPTWYGQNQANENAIANILNTTSRWYSSTEKNSIKFVSLSGSAAAGISTAIFEAPIVKKDGVAIKNYSISFGAVSYADVNKNPDDLSKIQISDQLAKDWKIVYKVEWEKVIMMLPINTSKDLYITVSPIDSSNSAGSSIEDQKFSASTFSGNPTQVLAENFSSSNSNNAITVDTCIRAQTENKVNYTRTINSALNATQVELSYRTSDTQGTYVGATIVPASDKSYTFSVPDRKINLFKLRPLGSNGAMVGNEIIHICKPDTLPANNPDTKITETTTTPSVQKKAIPVVPHTGPTETIAFILFASFLIYVFYKRSVKR